MKNAPPAKPSCCGDIDRSRINSGAITPLETRKNWLRQLIVTSAASSRASWPAVGPAAGFAVMSVLERVAHQDGVVALGAGRQQRHRALDQLLDALART